MRKRWMIGFGIGGVGGSREGGLALFRFSNWRRPCGTYSLEGLKNATWFQAWNDSDSGGVFAGVLAECGDGPCG